MPTLHHVILDTDIGSDVDDAMALAQILGTPEIELVAVTTVYGDTLLRARLAQRLASLAGRTIAVYAGTGEPFSGREVWWPGHEGTLHPNLERERVEDASAIDFLVDTVVGRPGEIDVVAIGPLTNIAAAIQADPAFVKSVKRLWIMGGAFTSEQTEHNFRSDDVAARIVFESGIPVTVTGLEITQRVEIRADQLARIAGAGALGAALEADIQQWWKLWDAEWNVPHDPITVLTLTQPELFEFSAPGRVAIAQGGEDAGRSIFTAAEDGAADGSVLVATGIRADDVAEQIVRAIAAAAVIPDPLP